MDDFAELKRQCQTAKLTAWSFLGSILVYMLVALLMARAKTSETLSNNPVALRFGFVGLTLIGFTIINIVKPFILEGSSTPETVATERDKSRLAEKLFSTSVISLSICEAPAVFGLILFFISRNMFDFYLFAAIAAGAIILNFPQYDQWESWVRSKFIE